MKKYHFSVLFLTRTIKYHGDFWSNEENIVDKAKAELTKKIKIWNEKAEHIIEFEVYYHEGEKEINIFTFKK